MSYHLFSASWQRQHKIAQQHSQKSSPQQPDAAAGAGLPSLVGCPSDDGAARGSEGIFAAANLL